MPTSVNKDLCIGCGSCISLCPNSFKLNEGEGKAEVTSQDDTDCAKNAAEGCPVQAIAIT